MRGLEIMARMFKFCAVKKYLPQKSPLYKELCFRKINLAIAYRTDIWKRHLEKDIYLETNIIVKA